MPHSILVRDLGTPAGRNVRLLAADIADPAQAAGIVERIVASYADNGRSKMAHMRWFRDKDGLHEIWAEPHCDRPMARKPPLNASRASWSLRASVITPDQTSAGPRVSMAKAAYACSA